MFSEEIIKWLYPFLYLINHDFQPVNLPLWQTLYLVLGSVVQILFLFFLGVVALIFVHEFYDLGNMDKEDRNYAAALSNSKEYTKLFFAMIAICLSGMIYPIYLLLWEGITKPLAKILKGTYRMLRQR